MKAVLLILVVVLVGVVVSCGQETKLTVSTDRLPAGGGSVTVTYKTSGYLGTVGFVLTSNPALPGFPIPWTGNMAGTVTPTLTQTTTFTISNVAGGGSTITSKTVSVQ
jgi:hypothetical protein